MARQDPRIDPSPSTVNETLLDRMIRHLLYLTGLQTTEANWMADQLDKGLFPKISDEVFQALGRLSALGNESGVLSISQQNALSSLKTEITATTATFMVGMKQEFFGRLKKIGLNELNFEHRLVKKTLPIEFEFKIPPTERIETWLNTQPLDGKPLNEWFDDIEAGTATRINKEIRLGLINGESTDEIARRIRGRRSQNYQDGVLGTTRRHATSIARSAVIFANDQASQAFYLANDDLFKGEKWILTLDTRTCFPKNTLIKTKKGQKPIQDIKVGELVLTHEGRYKKVIRAFEKENSENLLEIQTSKGSVQCTKDHEFLVLRGEEKNWLEAQDLLLTDKIYFDRNFLKKQRDHFRFKPTKEWFGFDSDNTQSLTLQKFISSFVSFFNRIVPISSINFKSNVMRWKEKVYTVCSNLIFLNKSNASRFKAYSDVFFTTGFPGVLSIAGEGAKAPAFYISGRNPELFVTASATDKKRWPSTLFRAVLNIFSASREPFAAPLAIFSNCVGSRTLLGAMNIPIGITDRYFKFITTFRAFFSNSVFSMFKVAWSAAKLSISRFLQYAKHLTTSDTFIVRWFRSVLSPVFVRAAHRTASRVTSFFKGFTANRAGIFSTGFHALNITKIEVKGTEKLVYDLEIETDHSYIANGFVVHNCTTCMAAEANSPYELGEGPRAPIHLNCRCLRIPLVKSFRELGIDLDEAPPGTRSSMNGQVPDSMTYNEWLRKQPRDVVEDALGKTKAKLFIDGDLSVTAFTNRRGNILSLDELRRKEADVFEALGL